MAPARRDDPLDQVLRQVELDDGDRARLQDLAVRLGPQLAEVADRFYAHVAAQPVTAALITGPDQAARLHATLVEWMASGLRGPYDRRFAERRARIGRQHVALGVPLHDMVTAVTVIRREYDDRIAALYEPARARLVARSADKLLDVELALMLRYYQLDSEAQLVARAGAAQRERVTALQTLSSGLAHEVRNPLNSAKLQLELLERRLRRDHADPKLLEPIELVHHELERLTRLLNEFLAFARPVPLALGDHDVVALVRAVVAAERPFAQARAAGLEVDAAAPVTARVDPRRLREVVSNLVRNGLEAVAPGGRVVVRVAQDDAELRLTVEDDGPGIPEAAQRRIYEPFFSTKEGGTGLGLSIVHSAVISHGGTVAIDSDPHGTRCRITLPRAGA